MKFVPIISRNHTFFKIYFILIVSSKTDETKVNKPQIKCDSIKFKVRLQTLSMEFHGRTLGESLNKVKKGGKPGQDHRHEKLFYSFICSN